MKIGIAVLAYNRPKHLKRVIDATVKQELNQSMYILMVPDKQIFDNQKIFKLLNKYKSKILINLIKQSKNNGLTFSIKMR